VADEVENFDEEIEIIFNDTTKNEFRSGVMQFMVKTGQFLHDFKNPLICIHNEIAELKDKTELLIQIVNESTDLDKRSDQDNSFYEDSQIERMEEKFEESGVKGCSVKVQRQMRRKTYQVEGACACDGIGATVRRPLVNQWQRI
jgi:hypothetical protein